MRTLGLPLILLLLAAAACGRGRSTPQQAVETLRSALVAADGRAIYEMHDREARGFFRDHARVHRARLERGESVADVLGDTELTEADMLRGDVQDAAVALVSSHGELTANADWFRYAVAEGEPEISADGMQARVLLRGTDGREQDIWLVKEDGVWAYDHYLTRWWR